MLVKLSFLSVFFFIFTDVYAQEKPLPITKPINSGVVNGKAVSLPKPIYPPAVENKPRPEGTVKVQVLIDENGKVISAKAAEGAEDVSLRQAAETAALQATFLPTTLMGKPVKVNGVIVYNFVNENPNKDKFEIFGLSTSLYMFRNMANNPELLKEVSSSEDIVKEISADFPLFSNEINRLGSLEKLSDEERTAKINEVITTIKNKLNAAEKWQFEIGENIGGIVSNFLKLGKDENFDPNRFDETLFKKDLLEIKELSLTAPSDIPADVLDSLKDLGAESEKERIFTAQNWQIFADKVDRVFNAISPASKNKNN